MKFFAYGILTLGLVACGPSEEHGGPLPGAGEQSSRALGEDGALPSSAFYFIKDAETDVVRETVLIAHNLSNHCPGGCSTGTLGTPVDGDEMRLLKLVFKGEVNDGAFKQGSQFIQASIKVGQAGCGVPTRIGPDGKDSGEGHPPGFKRHESIDGEVTVLDVSGGSSAAQIKAEVDVQFEVGEVTGSLLADHCDVLDSEAIEGE